MNGRAPMWSVDVDGHAVYHHGGGAAGYTLMRITVGPGSANTAVEVGVKRCRSSFRGKALTFAFRAEWGSRALTRRSKPGAPTNSRD